MPLHLYWWRDEWKDDIYEGETYFGGHKTTEGYEHRKVISIINDRVKYEIVKFVPGIHGKHKTRTAPIKQFCFQWLKGDIDECEGYYLERCKANQLEYKRNRFVDVNIEEFCDYCIDKCDPYRNNQKNKQIAAFIRAKQKAAGSISEVINKEEKSRKEWLRLHPNTDAIRKRLPGSYDGTKG